jgi:hypothetical protein
MFAYLQWVDVVVGIEILSTAKTIVNRESNVGIFFDE